MERATPSSALASETRISSLSRRITSSRRAFSTELIGCAGLAGGGSSIGAG